jgi:hypothetical protein
MPERILTRRIPKPLSISFTAVPARSGLEPVVTKMRRTSTWSFLLPHSRSLSRVALVEPHGQYSLLSAVTVPVSPTCHVRSGLLLGGSGAHTQNANITPAAQSKTVFVVVMPHSHFQAAPPPTVPVSPACSERDPMYRLLRGPGRHTLPGTCLMRAARLPPRRSEESFPLSLPFSILKSPNGNSPASTARKRRRSDPVSFFERRCELRTHHQDPFRIGHRIRLQELHQKARSCVFYPDRVSDFTRQEAVVEINDVMTLVSDGFSEAVRSQCSPAGPLMLGEEDQLLALWFTNLSQRFYELRSRRYYDFPPSLINIISIYRTHDTKIALEEIAKDQERRAFAATVRPWRCLKTRFQPGVFPLRDSIEIPP